MRSDLMSDEVFGYKCPVCKGLNAKDAIYCNVCGHWMLDTVPEAIPVTKKEYFSGSKASSSKVVSIKSADRSRRRTGGNITKVSSWVVILAIIALIVPFLPKGHTVSTIHYPTDVTTVSKDYDWTFNNTNYAWHVEVPSALLEWDRQMHDTVISYYANHNGYAQEAMAESMPTNVMDLVKSYSANTSDSGVAWVEEQQNYTFTGSLADALNTKAEEEHFNDEQKIEFLQSFVGGAIPYIENASYQLPAQTLVEGGNCGTKSVLLAAILKHLGYKVALLEYRDQDHMAIGVSASLTEFPDYTPVSFNKDGLSYYFLETTEPNWKLGQLSSDKFTDPVISPVN
jgi:hypothetical protein